MSEILIYSKFGEITAQSMTCVDITKSILMSEHQDENEGTGIRDGTASETHVEASDVLPPE